MPLIKSMVSSKSTEWATPQWLLDELNKEFNFTLDPCATKENHKCNKFYTIKEVGKKFEKKFVFYKESTFTRKNNNMKEQSGFLI